MVCAQDIGECVVCVGDEDCPPGEKCGADHSCHVEYQCLSDKDCKDFDMVCDKDAGICVQCLASDDCDSEQYCFDSYCIDDVCTAGEARCEGMDVVACNDEGSEEGVTETCTDTQYCEEGECHTQVCPPGKLYCEDNLLLTCDPVGKEIIETVDCEEEEKVCHQGECTEQNCEPNSTWCHDDFTAAACLQDGMSNTLAPCGSDSYCEDGNCKPQVCDAGSVFCDDEVSKVCNAKGSAIDSEEDCQAKQQHCFNGSCIDTQCPPNEEFCEDDSTKAVCAADGMGSTPEACPVEHYCDDGDTVQCLPWVCTPAAAFCEDNAAKVCNGEGSAIANEIPCGDNVCVGGACKPVVCDANTSACDGNVVMQCDATGTVEQQLETCGVDQYCEEQGDNAQCKDQVCGPGQKACEGSKVMQCNGIGSEQLPAQDCADAQKGCKDGKCVDQICTPNATYCDGNVVKKCSSDGSSASLVETCGDGQYCVEDGNAAACADQICVPNAKSCQGTKVMECDDVGAALEEFKDCADDGEGCAGGECVDCGPDCAGKECGPDGCGSTCGECGDGQFCINANCPPPGLECDDGNDDDYDGCTNNIVTQFKVYQGQSGIPRVALFPDDAFVVAFESPDGSAGGIKARVYDATATALGSAFQVNSYTQQAQRSPDVAVLTSGDFVVVWDSYGQSSIMARRYESDGTLAGDEYAVSEGGSGMKFTPRIAALTNGGYVVTYLSGNWPGSGDAHVWVALYNSDGLELLHYKADPTNWNLFKAPQVAALNDGKYLIVYQSDQDSDGSDGIFGRIYGPDGTVESSKLHLNTMTTKTQGSPKVDAFPDGSFVVLWTSHGQDGSDAGVFGRTFGSDGVALGDEFKANVHTANDQSGGVPATCGQQKFVAAWQSNLQVDGWDVFGRVYSHIDQVGYWPGDEMQINITAPDDQIDPDVGCFSDGGFVAVWAREGWFIMAQRFGPDGKKLYH